MKLYVNKGEIDALKEALRNAKADTQEIRTKQLALLERVILCEKLQHNVSAADARN